VPLRASRRLGRSRSAQSWNPNDADRPIIIPSFVINVEADDTDIVRTVASEAREQSPGAA
jgi:hypothetical protein